MINIKIKPRLLEISNLIKPNSKIIDVGADHALLDIYLNKYKNCSCLAIDISEKCIEKAKMNIEKYNANVQTKVNNGLENIKLNDEIIVISGMGTQKIKKILDIDLKNDLLIVSHTKIDELKEFLLNKKYTITIEKEIFDRKKYTIIYAKNNQNR
ncbi:MAG: tRNA (adenine(22)-N(1))-methyltransferase TrmK [Bacilli bacterium]|nr:tRNA (adenine(22)-N(1))-methyltransferase TrmK [Bacilli bacterium]